MPLTGIEIFKLLPKTNCGECGVPTCLAFAMKLAAGKAELSTCPYVSEEAKSRLEEASMPPIRTVNIGIGDRTLRVGGETVMFRHEKRFENPPGVAILVTDTMGESEIDGRLERYKQLRYQRVGVILHPELVAIKSNSDDAARFEALVNKVKQDSDCGIILMSSHPEVLAAGLTVCADRKPLLYGANKDNLEQFARLSKESKCPVGIRASSLEELAELSSKLTEMGVNDIVLDSGARTMRQSFENQVRIRSSALMKKFRPLGFPTIVFPCEMTDDPMKEVVIASIFRAKYGSIIVLSDFQGHSLFPLLVERMNIYSDPQQPLATNEGIYDIGGPDENSPVLLTTNFSLTYFIVSGEIETSKVPSRLLVMNADGLSVMTAWAAGKFTADTIASFVKKSRVGDLVKHHKLIIPGYAAVESGSLEDKLSGWEVLVGPREAAHIPAYLREWQP